MTTLLKKYIRTEETRQPIGLVVAVKDGTEVRYGYALLNTTMDKFNKKDGETIALARAMSDKGYKLPDVPERNKLIVDAFNQLEQRALRYFKDLDPFNVEWCQELDTDLDAGVPSPNL